MVKSVNSPKKDSDSDDQELSMKYVDDEKKIECDEELINLVMTIIEE